MNEFNEQDHKPRAPVFRPDHVFWRCSDLYVLEHKLTGTGLPANILDLRPSSYKTERCRDQDVRGIIIDTKHSPFSLEGDGPNSLQRFLQEFMPMSWAERVVEWSLAIRPPSVMWPGHDDMRISIGGPEHNSELYLSGVEQEFLGPHNVMAWKARSEIARVQNEQTEARRAKEAQRRQAMAPKLKANIFIGEHSTIVINLEHVEVAVTSDAGIGPDTTVTVYLKSGAWFLLSDGNVRMFHAAWKLYSQVEIDAVSDET